MDALETQDEPSRSSHIGRYVMIVVAAVILLYPLKTTIVPEWKIKVVNCEGRPLQNVQVRQYWQHYSFEFSQHHTDLLTDQNGLVAFPRRTLRSSVGLRAAALFINILSQGVHTSFGRKSWVISTINNCRSTIGYDPGEPLRQEIVTGCGTDL